MTEEFDLKMKLNEEVVSKRFLLVLDDIQGEREKWYNNKGENMLAPLSCKSLGSKILVTTRRDSVALMLAKKTTAIRCSASTPCTPTPISSSVSAAPLTRRMAKRDRTEDIQDAALHSAAKRGKRVALHLANLFFSYRNLAGSPTHLFGHEGSKEQKLH
ncbi:hypothetical protein IEQ34_001149 [Dendrobium chrysotoxum]|uniref:NB-ARC domain-containing protein n=1 Tax=Dendrobium chrysotoxum TaxID=161865 RepID=A0AAV7HKH9_DENCH|nr:hypothetical protein IEQ34_001149 [Dendrobium chrysotoxum]